MSELFRKIEAETPEEIDRFVRKSLAIADLIAAFLQEKGMTQKAFAA